MPEPDTTPAADAPTGWHYGPTATDPDPGKMWHYGCGQEVMYIDDGAVCGCGATWDENGQPESDTTPAPCRWPACLTPDQQTELADQVTASMHGQPTTPTPDPRPTCGCTEATAPAADDRPGLHQPLIPCPLAVLKRPHGGHSWEPQPGAPLVRCEGCSATGQQTEPHNDGPRGQYAAAPDDAPVAYGDGKGYLNTYCVACPRPDGVDIPQTINDVDHWEQCRACRRYVVDVAREQHPPGRTETGATIANPQVNGGEVGDGWRGHLRDQLCEAFIQLILDHADRSVIAPGYMADAALAVRDQEMQALRDELATARATNRRLNYRAQAAESELATYRRAVAQWDVSDRGTYIPHASLVAIGKAAGTDLLGSPRHLRHFARVEQAEATIDRVREATARDLPLAKFEMRDEPGDEERGWAAAMAAVEAALTPPAPDDHGGEGR